MSSLEVSHQPQQHDTWRMKVNTVTTLQLLHVGTVLYTMTAVVFITCSATILVAERISARLWIEDLFSQSTYVRACVRTYMMGHAQECDADCRYRVHRYRPYVWYTRLRYADDGTLWRWRWRLRTRRGHRGLDATTTANHIDNILAVYLWVGSGHETSPHAHWHEARVRMCIPSIPF